MIWSESVGAGAMRIIFRHILPNAIAPILVAMTLGIPAAILTEAGLSFLGLGVQPPYATWGNILNDGRDYIEIAWWMTLYPGLAILITVLSYNLMGRGSATRSIRACASRAWDASCDSAADRREGRAHAPGTARAGLLGADRADR